MKRKGKTEHPAVTHLGKLKGKRTYILSVLAGAATVAWGLGYIDDHAYAAIMGILAPGTAMALRAGITNPKGK